jgi:NADH:ubiquinone oxidoreductase subunit E
MPASAPVSERTHGAPAALLVHGPREAVAAGRHVFVVCNGESCRHAGSNRLLGLLRHRCRHQGAHQDVRISESKCLGRCGAAPAMVEDGRVLGWVSLHRLKSELMRLGLFSTAV